MTELPVPVVCDCGFATMDAKEAITHLGKCHPEEYYCPKCGHAWATHDGDGSCVAEF